MRIAQYQLVTAVVIPALAALAPAPAVHAADGLTGVSAIRALADDRTLFFAQSEIRAGGPRLFFARSDIQVWVRRMQKANFCTV